MHGECAATFGSNRRPMCPLKLCCILFHILDITHTALSGTGRLQPRCLAVSSAQVCFGYPIIAKVFRQLA